MVVTIITDGQPYIFEKVTYISVDRGNDLFHVKHDENIVLEDKVSENETRSER